ncbi:hypothetical protein BS78_K192000 [Paspalum vaginatum]|uniref:Uncharacterized protein n=1 Tax=Paspalum vaginatum TaxID=158149 RepID=A0A9W8CE81_9POAL|nr:hypothetical protein BS78_K192000 [Paspalum vaginatum]
MRCVGMWIRSLLVPPCGCETRSRPWRVWSVSPAAMDLLGLQPVLDGGDLLQLFSKPMCYSALLGLWMVAVVSVLFEQGLRGKSLVINIACDGHSASFGLFSSFVVRGSCAVWLPLYPLRMVLFMYECLYIFLTY